MQFTIIHIITGLSGGGAEHLVLDLTKRALDQGEKPIVISVTSENAIENKFKALGIEYHFLNIDRLIKFPSGIKKAYNILCPLNSKAVLHCHMFHGFIVGLFLKAFSSKTKIIFTLHNNSVQSLFRRIILLITKPLRSADIIFSKRGKKYYLKNTIELPNGVNLQKFNKTIEPNTKAVPRYFKFLFLGSLTEQKNPLEVPIIAQKLVKIGYRNFKIFFVGDGPLRKTLLRKIEELKIGAHVELMGFRDDIPDILADFHAQIMPSLWEGMPISILESGSIGLPVISTPVGSIPDYLTQKTGYLIKINDFHLAMIKLMDNYEEALHKASLFMQKVHQDFDIDKIYTRHQELYKSCL